MELVVEGLKSGYGRLPILHGVSLECGHRELVAVIGPNGAGKSTLMKTLFGLLQPMEGEVRLDGVNVVGVPCRELLARGMSYVPQEGNTFHGLSVSDNLQVGLYGVEDKAERVEEAFRLFPALAERRGQRASTLSGGERQMLAIASAWVSHPQLLVLDEPVTGLAPSIVDELIAMIRRFQETGTSILWVVEEDPLRVVPFADRVFVMQAGLVVKELSSSELLESDGLLELIFGSAEGQQADSRDDQVGRASSSG